MKPKGVIEEAARALIRFLKAVERNDRTVALQIIEDNIGLGALVYGLPALTMYYIELAEERDTWQEQAEEEWGTSYIVEHLNLLEDGLEDEAVERMLSLPVGVFEQTLIDMANMCLNYIRIFAGSNPSGVKAQLDELEEDMHQLLLELIAEESLEVPINRPLKQI